MFVVDATAVLPHPPPVVARVVEQLHALPRWCAGLRRARHPAAAPGERRPAGCVFSYATADVRFALRGHTAARAAGAPVRHAAEGDGLMLTWTLTVEPCAGDALALVGAPAPGPGHTRLRVRTTLEMDAAHPAAALRAAICRQLARRAPGNLDRLRVLLGRYEHGKAPAVVVLPALSDLSGAPPRVPPRVPPAP